MQFPNKRITVFGLGISGLAAAKKLATLGAIVFATDKRPAEAFSSDTLNQLRQLKVELELGQHSRRLFDFPDLIVVSPGIHLDTPLLEEARQKNIPIISEIELATNFISKPLIAITGSNGKTTTTTLIGEILKSAGKKIAVAGNIGAPLVEVDDANLDFIVAEISSYQLETVQNFCPHISVILNIQPDHLERHHTLEEYIRQKARIFARQSAQDFLVYNADDPQVIKMVQGAKAQKITFAKQAISVLGIAPEQIKIPGRHNLENALAAAQVATICGISPQIIGKVLQEFPGVEHRIEFVREINGVRFYNDSKATNPDSTLVALETFAGQPISLILGGREKGVSLDELCQAIKQKVKQVVLIGEAADKFAAALLQVGFVDIVRAADMQEAVRLAYQGVLPQGIVLLSPACASFDMFANFEERGKIFKECVWLIPA